MALTSDQITAQNFADFYTTIKPYLNGGGFQMKKLWENPDPTQSFASGNITLLSDDYDLLIIIANGTTSSTNQVSAIVAKGYGCCLDLTQSSSGIRSRLIDYVNSLTLSARGGVNNGNADNSAIIPYQIYGIKFYSYDNISCVMMSSTWEAGETTVEFTDPIIDGDSIFDVYLPSQYADLIYSSLSVSGHTLTITFPSAQASDIEVKLRVNRG